MTGATVLGEDNGESRGMSRTAGFSLDGRLASLAGSQEGAFSLQQALDLGFQRHQIRYRLDDGRWLKRLPRGFSLAGAPDTPAQRMILVHLWAGADSVICRSTAGWISGFAPVPATIEVTVPRRLKPPAPWVRVHRGSLKPCDKVMTKGCR